MSSLQKGLLRAIPINIKGYLQPFIYGLVGGLSAVGFQLAIKFLEGLLWTRLSTIATGSFVLISIVTILGTSLAAGLILTYVSRDAAGSGVPQLKIAFWRDFGYLPFKVVFAKFFAGVITIGGGCSLGREGPTVHIAGALASNIAGMLGVAKQGRRPALLSGAAAGLAAAFNTPLSAITFVMEEIVEDLNNTRFLAQTLVAAVTATFVAHLFFGEDPAFVIPSVRHFSWILVFLVPPTAALAALAGVAFQKGTLVWRDRIKNIGGVPLYLKPVIGAGINWVLGIIVFLWIARLGVFGLGYQDLEAVLRGQVNGFHVLILLVAKLAATTAVYAWGGAGGIFSPTLFFGATTGFLFGAICTPISSFAKRPVGPDCRRDERLSRLRCSCADHVDSDRFRDDSPVRFRPAADDRNNREPSGQPPLLFDELLQRGDRARRDRTRTAHPSALLFIVA